MRVTLALAQSALMDYEAAAATAEREDATLLSRRGLLRAVLGKPVRAEIHRLS